MHWWMDARARTLTDYLLIYDVFTHCGVNDHVRVQAIAPFEQSAFQYCTSKSTRPIVFPLV